MSDIQPWATSDGYGSEIMEQLVVNLAGTPAEPEPTQGLLEHEFGYRQQMPFSTWSNSSNDEILPERIGPSLQQLAKMRRESGQVQGLIRLIKMPILSSLKDCAFVPAEDGEKEAEFIRNMLTLPAHAGGMVTSLTRVMDEMLMAICDGFSAFEKVYWRPKVGPNKGKLTLKKLGYRPAETVTYLVDDHGNYNGFKQRIVIRGEAQEITIRLRDAVYFAVGETERPLYGFSMFSTAYTHWEVQRKVEYLWYLSLQRGAVGTRFGTFPRGTSRLQQAAFNRALADFGTLQNITVPEGFKVESVKEAGGSADYMNAMNFLNSQISKSVMAGFFDEDQGSGKSVVDIGGGQSDNFFFLMLQGLMDAVESVINNYVIPDFIRWNFNNEKFPTFKFGAFTDEKKDGIMKIFDRLITAPADGVIPQEFTDKITQSMADYLGLDLDFEAIKAEREAKLAKEAEAAATAAGGTNPATDPNADPQAAAAGQNGGEGGALPDPATMTPEQLAAELERING